MIVGICKVDLRIHGCQSLKEKRQVLRRLKDRTANKFGVPVAEVDFLGLWQRAQIGFSIVGNDSHVIEGLIQRMLNFIEDLGDAQILDQYTELVHI